MVSQTFQFKALSEKQEQEKKDSNSLGTHICDVECQKFTKIILLKSKYLCHLGNICVTINLKIFIYDDMGGGGSFQF